MDQDQPPAADLARPDIATAADPPDAYFWRVLLPPLKVARRRARGARRLSGRSDIINDLPADFTLTYQDVDEWIKGYGKLFAQNPKAEPFDPTPTAEPKQAPPRALLPSRPVHLCSARSAVDKSPPVTPKTWLRRDTEPPDHGKSGYIAAPCGHELDSEPQGCSGPRSSRSAVTGFLVIVLGVAGLFILALLPKSSLARRARIAQRSADTAVTQANIAQRRADTAQSEANTALRRANIVHQRANAAISGPTPP